MSQNAAPVDLVFLWHHHQPDYRSPREGRALLPWVRLHATKDYLDMALRLERHPAVRATFNFVPSLLDQLEDAAAGAPDALFDLLAKPVESLEPDERAALIARCQSAPRHAFERWPAYRAITRKLVRPHDEDGDADAGDRDLVALECWFLLAWTDPMFHGEPEAARAIAANGAFTVEHRDDLLELSRRLTADVIPAYRRIAERGQIELSASAYDHPINPLIVDVRAARRARPDLPLPNEPFAAPEDALAQIVRARERHARAFGMAPPGMWPPEGSVSPESVEVAARAGVRWMASDEGVLWHSLPPDARRREALYRPWRLRTPGGDVALLFRDHELSDRIGFVYQNWEAREAAEDFIGRVRRIGREHGSQGTPLVSVILDGENCWESYPEDGGPFLDALYTALAHAGDIRTRTVSEAIGGGERLQDLPTLHSGSWIDADFHIWIGHPEKNRAWELLARTRRALVESGKTSKQAPEAWAGLFAAEGSDWFWWYGDDHFTADMALFDRLFREHLQAVYEGAKLPVPAWLTVPISRVARRPGLHNPPLGFVHPVLDGKTTQFYEWYEAGRYRLGDGGGSMHRERGMTQDLYYGFDAERFYLRLDFDGGELPGADQDLVVEFLTPRNVAIRVHGLIEGERRVTLAKGEAPVKGAECRIGTILELGVPFATLGFNAGEAIELVVHLGRPGEPAETLPGDELVRFLVPDRAFQAAMWSA